MQTESTGAAPAIAETPCYPPFNFPSERSPVYAIAPCAKTYDVQSMLETKMAHLDALLQHTYGGSGESFRDLTDELISEYLWACSMLATECRELFSQLIARRFK